MLLLYSISLTGYITHLFHISMRFFFGFLPRLINDDFECLLILLSPEVLCILYVRIQVHAAFTRYFMFAAYTYKSAACPPFDILSHSMHYK